MNVNELVAEITAKMEAFQKDAHANAEKGNKAAGLRARKVSLELTTLMKAYRAATIAADKE